ncbi:MAG: galactose ABC transporter substrate-binding protein [Dorea sp.]|nr:galactose ABC transporter substrate-binding protein [Dorea sp.]
MKKRGLSSMLCAVLLMSLFCGCTAEEKSGSEELRVGVLLFNEDDLFISSMKQEIDKCFRKKEKEEGCRITVSFSDSMGSQTTQNEQIDTFIKRGYDVLCINLVDRTDAAAIIDKGKKADIPIVFFNREPVSADLSRWSKIYYVGTDASEGGRLQGEIFLDYYKKYPERIDKNGDGIIQYVLLEGEPGHQDAAIRTESCIKKIQEGGVEMYRLAGANANWRLNQGKEKMEGWLTEFGNEIEVVISNNDAMALGALDAMSASQWSDIHIEVVGMDGIEEALLAVKDGRMMGTVMNDAQGQAEVIAKIAYKLGRRETPENIQDMNDRVVRVPHDKISAEMLR